MDLDTPNNDVFLDLTLSLGPTRRSSVPTPPSVQPVTGEHHNFMQLLMSSPPLPPSPADGPPQLPQSVAPVNLHQSASQPIMDLGGNSLIGPWNVAATLTQPWPVGPQPVVGPSIDLSLPPVVALPPRPVSVPRTTRGPGRPATTGGSTQTRRRSSTSSSAAEERAEDEDIPEPYPWATTRPAIVHNLWYLTSRSINVISGQVHCRRCEKIVTVQYDLMEKFKEVSGYIVGNMEVLRDRAPSQWMDPRLPPCETCDSGMRPVISERHENINWLFLLLGQMLGCCTLEQLRYFCDMNNRHRTGAKDRVLYLTYLALCKQLVPSGPFDR